MEKTQRVRTPIPMLLAPRASVVVFCLAGVVYDRIEQYYSLTSKPFRIFTKPNFANYAHYVIALVAGGTSQAGAEVFRFSLFLSVFRGSF